MTDLLQTIEIETAPAPTATVIWLHGLGADAHDFEPAVPELLTPQSPPIRFVFPNAPVRPVTLNSGYPMRAWYDIRGLDRHSLQDEAGIRDSDAALRALIARENARGVAAQRIVIAGFSQGGAMALFTGTRLGERLAGLVGLSCYALLAPSFDRERTPANQHTPIFLAHGELDPVVAPALGDESRQLLTAAGYAVEWHSYRMAHSVCQPELTAIGAFLQRAFSA